MPDPRFHTTNYVVDDASAWLPWLLALVVACLSEMVETIEMMNANPASVWLGFGPVTKSSPISSRNSAMSHNTVRAGCIIPGGAGAAVPWLPLVPLDGDAPILRT